MRKKKLFTLWRWDVKSNRKTCTQQARKKIPRTVPSRFMYYNSDITFLRSPFERLFKTSVHIKSDS